MCLARIRAIFCLVSTSALPAVQPFLAFMALATVSSSSSRPSLMSKDHRAPSISQHSHRRQQPSITMTSTNDPMQASSSRTTSMAGKKRSRESDGDAKLSSFRRTKSVGDYSHSPRDKDRTGFQRSLIAAFVPAALKESMQGNSDKL